jgi:hypothetical protein
MPTNFAEIGGTLRSLANSGGKFGLRMMTTIRRYVPGDPAMLALLGSASFLETYADYVAGEDVRPAVHSWHVPNFHDA